jgi:murein DD-endopeptidase MepM/ murein hydrolase activator NlpD
MKPLLALVVTSSVPVVGLSVLGGNPGIADSSRGLAAQDFLLASAPPPVKSKRLWVQLVSNTTLKALADDLSLGFETLQSLNDASDNLEFRKGDWVVLPDISRRLIALSAHLNAKQIKTSAPLTAPPVAVDVVKVSNEDSVATIANRYGLTVADMRKLNPGVNLGRLAIGSSIRVANASPRALLAIRPGVSGGASWPALPSLPDGTAPGLNQSFRWPAKGVFTSGYGWRWGRMHKGIDIANNVGTPIQAAKDGIVAYSGWSSGYGYLVEISHGDGTSTRYAHNSRLMVRKGQIVPQGQTISLMGSTGRSTGPHLHFEIRKPSGAAVDPMAVLPSRRT